MAKLFPIIFILVTLFGCENTPREIPKQQDKTPPAPKSVNYYYTIKDIDFDENQALRAKNKDHIKNIAEIIKAEFIDNTSQITDKKYQNPDKLLAKSTVELEDIFKNNDNIRKAFVEYKQNAYYSINDMLREHRYVAPINSPSATCTADPMSNLEYFIEPIIRCMDIAYDDLKKKQKNDGKKTIIFRSINSGGAKDFEGLKYGCFNPGQQNYISDAGFGSATTSLAVAINHHDNIARGWDKIFYADTIYELNQKAIILMIEIDQKDPIFKFPKSLDTGTYVTVEEKEALLDRNYKFEFLCEPSEFLPEIPNEFEYIPDFKADATKKSDYKVYRVIRAKLSK